MSLFDHLFWACGHKCIIHAPGETHKESLCLPLLTPVEKFDEMTAKVALYQATKRDKKKKNKGAADGDFVKVDI